MLKHVLEASIILNVLWKVYLSGCETDILKVAFRFLFSLCTFHALQQPFLIPPPPVFTQDRPP